MSEDQWGSHLPALLAACEHTSGPILECGMGDHSTPVLHDFCEKTGRRLISCDTHPDWVMSFQHLAAPWHELCDFSAFCVDGSLFGSRYGVALVDHKARVRGGLLYVLRDLCDVVVMHDSECRYCGYTEPLKRFDWTYTHENTPAWTTLAGMGEPPEWLEALQPGNVGIPVPYRG